MSNPEKGEVRAEVRDISLGGCFVNLSNPLELHSDVELLFWLGATEFSMRGVVRRKVEGNGNGVEFVQPTCTDAAH